MKNVFRIAIACLMFSQLAKAQSIERSAIASSCGEGLSSAAQLTWTAGESITMTLRCTTNILSQGFQQLYINNTTSISPVHYNQIQFSAFPVPCTNDLTINTVLPLVKEISYSLINTLGVPVCSGKVTQSVTHIDTKELAAGEYFLILIDSEKNPVGTKKLNKNN